MRRHRRGGQDGCFLIMDQVAVDLVGDDDQVVLVGYLAQGADRVRPGQPAGRVVGQGDDDRADPASGQPRVPDRRREPARIADPALARRRGHEVAAGADQAGLRSVAHPAGARYGDIPADRHQQGEDQRLAARAADDRIRLGRQGAPLPVTGCGAAQRRQACYRAVPAAA